MRIAHQRSVAGCAAAALTAATGLAFAGPPGDYGDAPVGNNGDGINAYPGTVARWVSWFMHKNTVFSPQRPHGSWLNTGAPFWLGTTPPTTTADTTQTPGAPENDSDPIFLVHVAGPNPLTDVEIILTTAPGHNPNRPIYVNLFVDQNRDGQWKDGFNLATPLIAWNLEHCIQDAPLLLAAAMTHTVNFSAIRLENPTSSVWVRVMLSDEPIGAAFGPPPGAGFWDATMTAAHAFRGEIEDFRLDFMPAPPGATRTPGIWYRWIYNNWPPPPPPPPPKPACDVFYEGPWLVATPFCDDGTIVFPLEYRSSDRADGCTINPRAMFGMYGHKWLEGVMVPPTVSNFNPPIFAGGAGAPDVTCADGTVITVPATAGGCPGGCPKLFGGSIPVANLVAPGVLVEACYGGKPRFRIYRDYLETATCGSPHKSVTIRPTPRAALTSPAVVGDVGQRIDYVDLWAGGLLEAFIDLPFDRPWPDPDLPGTIVPLTPSGGGGLVENTFVSPPSSLRLREAVYRMEVIMPDGFEAEIIEMQLQGLHRRIQLVSADGETQDFEPPPPTSDWQIVALPVPAGFGLHEVTIETEQGAIDDVFIRLRERPRPRDCPECPADFDGSGGVDGDDIGSFFAAWRIGARCADVDVSGGIDGDDIGFFFEFWQQGGCEPR